MLGCQLGYTYITRTPCIFMQLWERRASVVESPGFVAVTMCDARAKNILSIFWFLYLIIIKKYANLKMKLLNDTNITGNRLVKQEVLKK